MAGAAPGSSQVDLGGDGDDVRLSELGHGLYEGGGGVGGEVGAGVGDGRTKEQAGREVEDLVSWSGAEGGSRRVPATGGGRRTFIEPGGPVEPRELVDHPGGGVCPHTHRAPIRRDGEDVRGPSQGGDRHPPGVRREGNVLD